MVMFNPISPILPDVSVNEMRGLMTLLHIIGNPNSAAAAGVLQQFSDKADEAQKILESNNEKVSELHKLEAQRKIDMDAFSAAKVAHDSEKAQLEASRAEVFSLQQKLRGEMTAHENRVQAHTEKERQLQARESAVTSKEKEVSSSLEALAAKQREFDEKMAPILAAAQLVRR
jgi:hypothetical protein